MKRLLFIYECGKHICPLSWWLSSCWVWSHQMWRDHKNSKKNQWVEIVTGETKREVQRKVKRHTARKNQIKKERDSPSCGRKPTAPLGSIIHQSIVINLPINSSMVHVYSIIFSDLALGYQITILFSKSIWTVFKKLLNSGNKYRLLLQSVLLILSTYNTMRPFVLFFLTLKENRNGET